MAKKSTKKQSIERKEAWMRIVVAIVTGIILAVWRYFIFVLILVHWFYAVFSGKRNRELAGLCEIWNTQLYVFVRYLSFVSNKRPFPFDKLAKDITKFER